MSFGEIAKTLTHRRHGLPGSTARVRARRHDRAPTPGAVRSHTVLAEDGVELYVEVQDVPHAPATVIFCHGYLLNSTSWHVQRTTLAGHVRVVLWDLRGHGRSGWGSPPNATIDQLGSDLYAVLRAVAPRGPVVLVGHSMGGMAIMGLAEQHPELFDRRIVGVALISTSAGDLSSVTVGLPARTARILHRVVPVTLATLRGRARLVDACRRPLGGISYVLSWPYLFGSRVPRPVAELTTRLMASVPIQVIADFYTELIRYDKRAALPTLGRVPVLVIVGAKDLITPPPHSEAVAAAIPGADLVVIPDAGHLLILERAVELNEHLWSLLEQVTGIAPATTTTVTGDDEAVSPA